MRFYFPFLILFLLRSQSLAVTPLPDPADSLFDLSIHTIKLYFNKPGYVDTMLARYERYHEHDTTDEDQLMARVVIDDVSLDSIGVKFKSNFSYSIPSNKKPMKLDFNVFVKGQRFMGLRALNLSNEFPDPSMLRNTVAYWVMSRAGIRTPRTSFAMVYLNDKYHGLYVMIEQIDKSYLERQFGHSGGDLFKAIASSLQWIPNDSLRYPRYFELKSKDTPEAWRRVIDLAELLNLQPYDSLPDTLINLFDIDSYIPVFAADVIFNNWDSYFFGQNYYLFRDTATGRWTFLPWDYNVALNNYDVSGGNFEIVPGGHKAHYFTLPLPSRILRNDKLKDKYFQALCEINKQLGSDSLKEFILLWHSKLRSAMIIDHGKSMTIEEYDRSLKDRIALSEIEFEGLLSFINYRHKQIKSLLAIEGISCE